MKKKMNNKGFSLVELIVVIAIMAVLIGLLAPQFIKYVNRTRYSTDVKNGQEIATMVQTLISDNKLTSLTDKSEVFSGSTAGSTAGSAFMLAKNAGLLTEEPKSKVDSTKGFFIVYNTKPGNVKVRVYVGNTATTTEMVYPELGQTYKDALDK